MDTVPFAFTKKGSAWAYIMGRKELCFCKQTQNPSTKIQLAGP